MTLIQSLILGIIQGLTEFLPISSSAHLVLIPHLLGWQIPEAQVFPFDVLVQLGTLVAVILYFWKDLWNIIKGFVKALIDRKPFGSESARLGWFLILATIPAGLAGVLIKNLVEAAFNSVTVTALFLFGTALLLVLAELLGKRNRTLTDIKWLDALVIGLFQMVSLFPGISRSASTISAGMFRKFDRSSAARFSFLMSVPVMLGAGAVSLKDALSMPGFGDFLPVLLVGFLAALLGGYLAIQWFISYLSKRSLYIFAAYCALLAIGVLVFGALHKDASAAILPSAQAIEATDRIPLSTPFSGQSPSEVSTANPGENPLTVAYTSSISWITPVMTVSTNSIPGLAIVTRETPIDEFDYLQDKITLRWGPPAELTAYAAKIGTEQLAVIVHLSNPLSSITPELIQKIYTSQLKTWGEIYTACPDCFSSAPGETLQSQVINYLSYSNQSEPQNLFLELFMGGNQNFNTTGLIVPGSIAMQTDIGKDPDAIGFLGSRFVNGDVKSVTITGNIDLKSLTLPILAISSSEPSPTVKIWLGCLQQVLNP